MSSTVEVGDALRLPPEEAHHVLKVLRGRSGDAFEIVDAGGRLFAAELREGSGAVVLEQVVAEEQDVEVTLYQAVPKGRHMDLVVEKATEIGVHRIVPLVAERSVVKLGGRDGKLDRWRRVALSAARQSLRLRVPEVGEPVSFFDAVREVGEGGVLLHNGEGLPSLEEILARPPVALLVGPEGGWSERELRAAESGGLGIAQLGPYRLRSETAGIVSATRAWTALERSARDSIEGSWNFFDAR